METLQDEIRVLERKLREAKKQVKDQNRAREIEEFETKITETTKRIVQCCCGNCGNVFYWGEYLLSRVNAMPNFCSECGAKVKK